MIFYSYAISFFRGKEGIKKLGSPQRKADEKR